MTPEPILLMMPAKPAGPRSPHWPTTREHHLQLQPVCQACGGKDHLEVHHKKPFHKFPALELVQDNLITLCESPSHNCHFVFGHLLDWHSWNVVVEEDAKTYHSKVSKRPTA